MEWGVKGCALWKPEKGNVALSNPPPTRLCLFGLSARRPAFWTSLSINRKLIKNKLIFSDSLNMLRIPNPISDLTEVVKIYCDIFPILKSYKDFELDVVSKALIQTSNVTSQGAIGIEALERSTRADRSRDPIYNQSKALCELYRLLGWLQSTTAQTKYIVTYLGEALVNAKDKDNVVEECLIGLSYPNECVEVKANTNLRPFKSILYYLNMNNSLSRDEIIYGVLNIDDDTNAQELESLSKKMIAFRKIRNGLKNELILDFNGEKRIFSFSMTLLSIKNL